MDLEQKQLLRNLVTARHAYLGEKIVRQLEKDSQEIEYDNMLARLEGALQTKLTEKRNAGIPPTRRELIQRELAERDKVPQSVSSNFGFGDILVARSAEAANELRNLNGFSVKAGGIDPRIGRLVI